MQSVFSYERVSDKFEKILNGEITKLSPNRYGDDTIVYALFACGHYDRFDVFKYICENLEYPIESLSYDTITVAFQAAAYANSIAIVEYIIGRVNIIDVLSKCALGESISELYRTIVGRNKCEMIAYLIENLTSDFDVEMVMEHAYKKKDISYEKIINIILSYDEVRSKLSDEQYDKYKNFSTKFCSDN